MADCDFLRLIVAKKDMTWMCGRRSMTKGIHCQHHPPLAPTNAAASNHPEQRPRPIPPTPDSNHPRNHPSPQAPILNSTYPQQHPPLTAPTLNSTHSHQHPFPPAPISALPAPSNRRPDQDPVSPTQDVLHPQPLPRPTVAKL